MKLLEGNEATARRKFSYRGHFIHSETRVFDPRNLSRPGYVWYVEWDNGTLYYPIGRTRKAAKHAIDNKVEGIFDYLPA